MGNKKRLLILFSIFLALLIVAALINIKPAAKGMLVYRNRQSKQIEPANTELLPERLGEEIIYDIKLGNITLGKSVLHYAKKGEVNGKLLNLMILKTGMARFRDTEKIYSDPKTLLPVKVEREISKWFDKEKITEEYDQENFTVVITKKNFLGEEKTTIKKNAPINSAILLPYYVRRLPNLEIGQSFIANLPNNQFEIKLTSIEPIEIPAGVFKAYHFESMPKQIEIWISIDERRIPLMIKGTGTYGYTMVMKKYTF